MCITYTKGRKLYPYIEYMMKDTKTEKDKLHRYLDDLYTRDDASQLLQSIKDSENQDILDELAAEVWEESGNLQPGNDLDGKNIRERHANY